MQKVKLPVRKTGDSLHAFPKFCGIAINIDRDDNIPKSGKVRALWNGKNRNRGNTNDPLGMRSHKDSLPPPGTSGTGNDQVDAMCCDRRQNNICKPAFFT
ncbi:hypothetical protein GCM10010967_48040 [Dyadobacter beijingensis]|uniref:Uncharacterized protein n=1 Tax=Dyadobacter beijingensis TaxID=365489 RepID=A0ABQ2ICH3_9BACT|nr:hypothetical protein GCM10010967_48040 [Dyadobacter beijingensis]